MPHLEFTELVLVNSNIVNSDYEHDSRVFYTFLPNKLFGQLLDALPKNFLKFLAQSFHIYKYGLLIKILNHWR